MKNILIMLGLLGPAAALAQTTGTTEQITQKGDGNVIRMEVLGAVGDTLAPKTRTISQKGSNLVQIETMMPGDSLNRSLHNVAIDQQGKKNTVFIQSQGGQSNSVQISQSGSGNTISIKQN